MSPRKFLIASLAVAFVFQEAFGGHFVLLVLLGWILVRPTPDITWWAFWSGLTLDLFSNAPFGTNSLLFLIFTLTASLFLGRGILTIRTLYLAPYVFVVTGVYDTFLDLFCWGRINLFFNFRQGLSSVFWTFLIVKSLWWAKERIVFEKNIQLNFGL